MPATNFAEYTDTTARLAILKAKAAYTCNLHPDVLILAGDPNAERRAFEIAGNTLTYNDRTFLAEKLILVLKRELETAGTECWLCKQNLLI
ncbi:hypothetical protein [Dyadobacter sp. NIV53]|uniref:hypothetical protein n=1 Tax=Dyadobacter sp. NIV53 TaxID=2861765 RepID=UPI001C88C74A|nr:hypothetical protein [Dyadobacter sp. NIV53]